MRRIYILLLLLCTAAATFAQTPAADEQAAIALYKAGKTDEAQAAFTAILKKTPKNAGAINALSQICYAKDDYAGAYKWASEGMKINAADPNFIITRANAGLELGKTDESLSLMDGLIAKQPGIAYAHYVRGRALDAKGQKQQAIGAYSKAIAADATMLMAYRLRGSDFMDISRYGDALKDFSQYIAADATSPGVYNMRGLANYHLGNADAAIADFTKSIELEPRNSLALNNRAGVYMDARQTASAKSDYEKAMSLDPQNAESCYGLARVYNAEKAYAQALPMAEKSIALHPDMPPYLAVYCMTLIGLNRDKEAIPVAEKILAIDDKNTDGYMYKASAQSNISDFTAAIATMNTAIAKVPDNYLLYALRGGIYREKGDAAAAASDDAKAKELSAR